MSLFLREDIPLHCTHKQCNGMEFKMTFTVKSKFCKIDGTFLIIIDCCNKEKTISHPHSVSILLASLNYCVSMKKDLK